MSFAVTENPGESGANEAYTMTGRSCLPLLSLFFKYSNYSEPHSQYPSGHKSAWL
jgi:hypothetical protein